MTKCCRSILSRVSREPLIGERAFTDRAANIRLAAIKPAVESD